MTFTRRAHVAAAAAAPGLAPAAQASPGTTSAALPARAAFARMPYVYLDSGSTHPMPLGARAALEEYLRYKTRDGLWPGYSMDAKEKAVRAWAKNTGYLIQMEGATIGKRPKSIVRR